MKTIEITITKDGETKIEAKGYEGESCELDTKELERALGGVTSRKTKPERYRQGANEKARA